MLMLQSHDVIIYTAGGLATYLHADHVSAYLPKNIKFRAFADAGYFTLFIVDTNVCIR